MSSFIIKTTKFNGKIVKVMIPKKQTNDIKRNSQ